MCVCVCVYDGNSCFKKKKRGGLFGGRREHLRFLFGQFRKAVGLSFPTCFFFPPPPPFPFLIRQSCRRETTYTYFVGKIGHFTPPVHISLSSHKNLASEDQSVPSARLRLDRTDRCTRVLSHICSRIRAAKKEGKLFPSDFSLTGGGRCTEGEGGRERERERERGGEASEETRNGGGKNCLSHVYLSVNLCGRMEDL